MNEKERLKIFNQLFPKENKKVEKEEPKEEVEVGIKKKDSKWWSKFFSKDKLKKPDRVAVIYLRNNGRGELLECQTRGGFFEVGGKKYHEDKDCVYTVTKDRIPLLIVREWDMTPLGTKKRDDETMHEKFADLEQHVLKGIRQAELVKTGGGLEGNISRKQVVIYVIIAIVLGALAISFI